MTAFEGKMEEIYSDIIKSSKILEIMKNKWKPNVDRSYKTYFLYYEFRF